MNNVSPSLFVSCASESARLPPWKNKPPRRRRPTLSIGSWAVLDNAIRDIIAALPVGAWLLFALAGLASGLVVAVIMRGRRRARAAAELAREAAERAAFETRLAEANRVLDSELGELRGRLAAMAETSSARHNELAGAISSEQLRLSEALTQRLDLVTARLGDGLATVSHRLSENFETVSQRLGSNLADATMKLGSTLADTQSRNADSLSKLHERLALIDQAGASLSELSNQVVTLKDVLGNKQMRGAFGQVRMEAIIEDSLPRGAYEFQATLSNGSRPDCLVRLPSAPAPLVIDAKFPLEGFEALRIARTPEEVAAASARIREAIGKHVDAIAGKYLIAGETQDTALMFVPSEQVYAELHERFTDLVQKSHRARVVIVSPNVLMPRPLDHAGDPEGRPHARAGGADPARSRFVDGRCRPPRRAGARPRKAFHAGFKGRRENSSPRPTRSGSAARGSTPSTSPSRRCDWRRESSDGCRA